MGGVALSLLLALSPKVAQALPLGGTLASGAASFSSAATRTVITQTSDRAVIDWQSFDLATEESVEFIVPTDQSATLNRINGHHPTVISGTISSNGTVYFTNPNGLVFDSTSRVTANGFFAATAPIAEGNFIAGGLTPATVTNLGRGSLRIDGTITAPKITLLGGTVTVGGTLEAPSGTILVSSTNLTTIGQTAVISVDAGQNGNGGQVKIWSDNHTDFYGYISARGGTRSGDGGAVEVSGKSTLNFDGMVTTLAAQGMTGKLLLDPSDITISSSGTDDQITGSPNFTGSGKTSRILVATLLAALGTSNVTVDATAGSSTGSGSITVNSPVSWSNVNSLTLTAGLGGIKINSTISSGSGGVILDSQGTVTIVPGADWTLGGDVTIVRAGAAGSVRIDLAGHSLLGGKTLTATGLNLFYTSAVAGNLGTIVMGIGTFTYVNDQRVLGAVTLSDSTNGLVGDYWGAAPTYGGVQNARILGGLTISGTKDSPTIGPGLTGLGVVYGGTVDIQGISSGAARDLRYIEGTGVSVTAAASSFTGALTLVANGSGTWVGYGIGGTYDTQGIAIHTNLAIGSRKTDNLTLIQSGTVSGHGILTSYSTVTAGGDITVIQAGSAAFSGILPYRSSLNAGRVLTLIQTGSASLNGLYAYHSRLSAKTINLNQSGSAGMNGIHLEVSSLSSNGTMNLNQAGNAGQNGIRVEGSNLLAGGTIRLHQSGSAGNDAIAAGYSNLTSSGGEVSLVQSGTIGDGNVGIYLWSLYNSGPGTTMSFAAANNGFVTFETKNQTLSLNSENNFTVTRGLVRIDLGTAKMISKNDLGRVIPDPQYQYSLKALGLDVFFTASTADNSVKIDVGAGSFTAVIDNRSTNAATVLSTASLTAPTYGGLTIIGTGPAASRSQVGVVYGGAVTLNGVTAAGAGVLSYIEGTSITTITAQSNFAHGLVLRTSGSLTIGQDLTTMGKITIQGHDLSLSNAITTSGGAVSISLGGGYSNGAGAGYSWTSSNNPMTLYAAEMTAGTGAVFVLSNASLATNLKVKEPHFGDNSYFTNDATITDDETLRDALSAANESDDTAEYHRLSELSTGISQYGFSGDTGTISYGTMTSYTTAATKVTLWNVTDGEISRPVTAKEVVFAGTVNSFTTGFTINTSVSSGNAVTLKTAVTAGGKVILNLGGGTYLANDKKLTTNGQELQITAAAITSTSGSVIFDLKGGVLSGIDLAHMVTVGQGWSNDYGAIVGDPTAATVHYYVTQNAGGSKAGISDANGIWLDANDFAAEKPFEFSSGGSKITDERGGVYRDGDVYKWGAKDFLAISGGPTTMAGMTDGRPVTFVNFGTSLAPYSRGFASLKNPSAIDFQGDNTISGGLTLSVGGAIDLASSGSLKVTGGDLNLTSTNSSLTLLGRVDVSGKVILTSAAAITVTGIDNQIATLGKITANGMVVISSSTAISLTDSITSSTSATKQSIILTAAGLSLADHIITRGGHLTLNLGMASLDMKNRVLTTTNQNLTLTAGSIIGTSIGTALFRLGEDGRLFASPNLLPKSGLGEVNYYAYLGGGGDGLGDYVSDIDPNSPGVSWNLYSGVRRANHRNSETVVWLPLELLTNPTYGFKTRKLTGESSGLKLGNNVGEWLWFVGGTPAVSLEVVALEINGRDLIFNTVTASAAVTVTNAATIRFVGNNSFTNLTLSSWGEVTQSINSRIRVSEGLNLNQVRAIRLTNQTNQITSVSGDTAGGSVAISTSGGVIYLDGLKTGGGSVAVVNTGGGINGSGIMAGGFSFRAAGAVSVSGSFASTEGYGSSVSINNSSASWVAGNLMGDSGVNLGGTGSVILTGTVSSSGSVDIQSPATVANSVALFSGGTITIAQQINAINSSVLNDLTLNAGVINLKANIGSLTKLGWVEIKAVNLNNLGGYSITTAGGLQVPQSK